MSYECPSFRKSKRDKRKKRQNRVYKRGGQHRTMDIEYAAVKQE